jgi:hypothetical protein
VVNDLSVATAVNAAIVTVLKLLPALLPLVWQRRLLLIKPLLKIKVARKRLHSKAHHKASVTNAVAAIATDVIAQNVLIVQ